MALWIRLLRAVSLFAVIFLSYMVQLGLTRIFRRRIPSERRAERYRLPEWLDRRRERVDFKNARRLLGVMLKLRGVYIKLGQVLSILGGFLPRVYTKELESLQDQVPPHPYDEVERVFVDAFEKRPDEAFKSIETKPIAAASLGQVHVAFLDDGRKVAVKFLYPGIREMIRIDMRVVRMAMRVYQWFFPFRGIEHVHEALQDLLDRETNYEHEASCIDRMSKEFDADPDVLFPTVVSEWSSRDVLTMRFMEGIKISRLDELDRLGIDRTAVATKLVQSFYKQLFVHRFFHADPHPGNFLVQAGADPHNPKLVILDFGAICEVSRTMVDGLLDIVQALVMGNTEQALAGFRLMGFVDEQGNRELLERTVVEYFQRLLKLESKSAASLLGKDGSGGIQELGSPDLERAELRELMRSIRVPREWFYIERGSVMLFWLSAILDPKLDTMAVGLPYVLPLVAERQVRRESEAALIAAKAPRVPKATDSAPPPAPSSP